MPFHPNPCIYRPCLLDILGLSIFPPACHEFHVGYVDPVDTPLLNAQHLWDMCWTPRRDVQDIFPTPCGTLRRVLHMSHICRTLRRGVRYHTCVRHLAGACTCPTCVGHSGGAYILANSHVKLGICGIQGEMNPIIENAKCNFEYDQFVKKCSMRLMNYLQSH